MKIFFSALFLLLGLSLSAQTQQGWIDFTLQKKQTEKVSWSINTGPRFQKSYGLYTYFVTSGLHYKVSKVFIASLGLSYFFSDTPNGSLHEIRPWQGLRADFKILPRLTFLNNLRLEERWFTSSSQNEWVYRLRFHTGLTYIMLQNKEKGTSFYTPVSFEIFEDLNKKLFVNRSRLYIGMGYGFKKNRVELFYIRLRQRQNAESHLEVTQDIGRVRWFHMI